MSFSRSVYHFLWLSQPDLEPAEHASSQLALLCAVREPSSGMPTSAIETIERLAKYAERYVNRKDDMDWSSEETRRTFTVERVMRC